jgi:hypothetical protein
MTQLSRDVIVFPYEDWCDPLHFFCHDFFWLRLPELASLFVKNINYNAQNRSIHFHSILINISRSRNQSLPIYHTRLGTNGKSTDQASSLFENWATDSSAKSGKESGITRHRWQSRHSSQVRLHPN